MTGKLLGILVMALVAIFAFKWLRGQNRTPRPPAPRRKEDAASSQQEQRQPEKVIELERGEDGVYRPRDE